MSAVPQAQWQRNVTRHFQRAAQRYGDASALQQASLRDLLADCPAQGVTLELGAGHGQLAHALAARDEVSAMIALDVSEAMLRQGMRDQPSVAHKLARVVASALAIPLPEHSVDTIVSHFALHWCLAPQAVAAELQRVIRRDGLVQLAIPVAGSLAPLHGAAGDGALLLPLTAWQQAFGESWQVRRSAVKTYTRYFANASAWLAYLRAMGVTASPGAAAGLSSKQHYRDVLARIDRAALAVGEGTAIPFSFHVWHACLQATD